MKGINKNLQKLHLPDSIEPMQKVLENSCQSCKTIDNFLEKYPSGAISPICVIVSSAGPEMA